MGIRSIIVHWLALMFYFSMIVSCQKDTILLVDSVQEEPATGTHVEKEDEPAENNNTGRSFTLSILGDSISTFIGCLPSDFPGYDGAGYKSYYPQGDVNSVQKTWWYQAAMLLNINPECICNCSWSGSKVTGDASSDADAAAGCSNRRIKDLSARGFEPDIIICFISCNDWAHNVSLESMSEAYSLMLKKIHLSYPTSDVFCMSILEDRKRDATPGWPSNNRNGISCEAWNSRIQEIASASKCHLIALDNCGINYESLPRLTVDGGLHPNAEGMKRIAQTVFSSISSTLNSIQE